MNIFLGNGLTDYQGISMQLDTLGDKLLIGNLATKIVGVNHVIALQPIVAGITFHVHNGVDTHRVGIGTRRGSNNNYLSAYVLTDIFVTLMHIHSGRFHFGHMNAGIIHSMGQ